MQPPSSPMPLPSRFWSELSAHDFAKLQASGLAAQTVAVLTVDPSSQRSGGSILGDKTRMEELVKDEMNIQQGTNIKHYNFDTIEKGVYFISLTGKDGVTTQNIIVQ